MACRNCGRSEGALYEVVLSGDREVAVTLCESCREDYADLGWIDEAVPLADDRSAEE